MPSTTDASGQGVWQETIEYSWLWPVPQMVRLIALPMFAALTFPVFAGSDVRTVSWGMARDEVIANEATRPAEILDDGGESIVIYESTELDGLPSQLLYYFADGELVRAKYLLNLQHQDPNAYVDDFRRIELILREKHGSPSLDRAYWEDDEFQAERVGYLDQDRAASGDILPSDAFIGETLANGHLTLSVEWGSERTTIVHGLTAVGDVIVHQVEYRTAEREDAASAAR